MYTRAPISKCDSDAHADSAKNQHGGNPLVVCRAIDDTEERVPINVPQTLTHTPLPRRIPCRARGLVKTHNKQTAYFEIPYNSSHGMVVRCSRPECYGTDRGFRYCLVCNRQVAHRNFLNRHGHGIITTHQQLKEAAIALPPPSDSRNAHSNNSQTSSHPATYQQYPTYQVDRNRSSYHADMQEPQHSQPFPNLSHTDQQWISLLHGRPADEDFALMKQWIDTLAHHPNHPYSSAIDLTTVRDDPQETAAPSTTSQPRPGPRRNISSFRNTTSSTCTAAADITVEPYHTVLSRRNSKRSFQCSPTSSSIAATTSNIDRIYSNFPPSTVKDDRHKRAEGQYNFFELHFAHDDEATTSANQAIEPIDVKTDYGFNFLAQSNDSDDFSSLFD